MRVVKRNYYDEEGNLLIKPYKVKDLAAIYDVSNRTIKRWIATVPDVEKKDGQYYSIADVKKIIEGIGLPQKIVLTKKAA